MKTRIQKTPMLLAATFLLVAALACNSSVIGDLQNVGGTAAAVATEANRVVPTFQAEMTQLAVEFTANAPAYNATMTAIVGTAQAIGQDPALQTTAGALLTQFANVAATPEPGRASPDFPVYGDFDGLNTALLEKLEPGVPRTATLGTILDAHNWVFDGTTGQIVTVRVIGQGDANFRAALFDPLGTTLTVQDDNEGLNPVITYTLPADGLYTIRIDAWTPGTYAISVE